MTPDTPPVVLDAENPEWTDAYFARARPALELPAHIRAAFPNTGQRRAPGRPAGSDKERITIRLDKDVLAKLRASRLGWQSRVNDAVRKAVGL